VAELPLLTVSGRLGLRRGGPCVPVAYSGIRLLAQQVGKAPREAPGVKVMLLAAHGLNAMAADPRAAYALADLAECTAKQACIAHDLGVHLTLPPREALAEPDAVEV